MVLLYQDKRTRSNYSSAFRLFYSHSGDNLFFLYFLLVGIQKIYKYFCAAIEENEKEKSADAQHIVYSRKNFISAEERVELIGTCRFKDETKEAWYDEAIYPNVCLWKVVG